MFDCLQFFLLWFLFCLHFLLDLNQPDSIRTQSCYMASEKYFNYFWLKCEYYFMCSGNWRQQQQHEHHNPLKFEMVRMVWVKCYYIKMSIHLRFSTNDKWTLFSNLPPSLPLLMPHHHHLPFNHWNAVQSNWQIPMQEFEQGIYLNDSFSLFI